MYNIASTDIGLKPLFFNLLIIKDDTSVVVTESNRTDNFSVTFPSPVALV